MNRHGLQAHSRWFLKPAYERKHTKETHHWIRANVRTFVSPPLRKMRDPAAKDVDRRRPPRAPRSRSLPRAPGPAPRERPRGAEPQALHFRPHSPSLLRPPRCSPPPSASIGAHSPRVQNSSKRLQLRAQPRNFQFARDPEAPPNGHDVRSRPRPQPPPPPLCVARPSFHPGSESFLSK